MSFVTPLLGTLGGKVYFGDGFRLYVVVDGPGVQVKLAGDVKLDPATGQITTIFDNLPQVPFTAFALQLQRRAEGGARTTRRRAGRRRSTPRSRPGAAPRRRPRTASFTIDQGCALPAFAPGLKVSAASTAAGRPAGSVAMEITRPDGAEDISQVTADLPPGLAGSSRASGLPDAGRAPAGSVGRRARAR